MNFTGKARTRQGVTMAYTNDQRMAFVMQRAQGKSFDKIADDLGITKQTLIKCQGEKITQRRE